MRNHVSGNSAAADKLIVRLAAELSEHCYQNILQRKVVIHCDPMGPDTRMIGSRQRGSDATAFFD
jgi:hypothetical protein